MFTDFLPKIQAEDADHSEYRSERLDAPVFRLKRRNTMVLLPDIASVVLKNHPIS
jgi:hypothetical protein